MHSVRLLPLQSGLAELVPDLIGLAGTLVLALMVLALAGVAYRALTGGIEWPEEEADEEEDRLQRGSRDDEWDYY